MEPGRGCAAARCKVWGGAAWTSPRQIVAGSGAARLAGGPRPRSGVSRGLRPGGTPAWPRLGRDDIIRCVIVVDLDAKGGFEALVEPIGVGAPPGRPRVVALDGRSGVGKSTLAARLASATGATVIDGDAFFAGGIDLRRDPPARRAAECIDWRRQREVLSTLREGRAAAFRAFDWDAFDGSLASAPTIVPAAPLFVLEGVYAARPELRDLVDLRVLLRVPDDVRSSRLELREGGIGEWERAWHEAEVWYFANAAPEASFDIVVHQGADS